MEELANRRRGPFVVLAALFVTICVVVIAVPDSVLAQVERNRPLTDGQSGWAYRLLAFFALVQIVYTGMSVFRVDRLQQLRERDERFSKLPKAKVISSLVRNAAALVSFTLVYGVASIALTEQRGGFWLFPVLAIAQGSWYYREIGQIAAWKSFQPEPVSRRADEGAWTGVDADYPPPLTRGLTRLEAAATD